MRKNSLIFRAKVFHEEMEIEQILSQLIDPCTECTTQRTPKLPHCMYQKVSKRRARVLSLTKCLHAMTYSQLHSYTGLGYTGIRAHTGDREFQSRAETAQYMFCT